MQCWEGRFKQRYLSELFDEELQWLHFESGIKDCTNSNIRKITATINYIVGNV